MPEDETQTTPGAGTPPAEPKQPAPQTAGSGDKGAAGSEKTFTQDDLNRIIDDRLQRERRKYTDYDQLKESVSTFEQQMAKRDEQLAALKTQLDQITAAAKQAQAESLRTKVAARHKLPEALAERLRGETEEDLEADAKSLAELLPKGGPGSASGAGLSPGNPAGAQTPSKASQIMNRIQGGAGLAGVRIVESGDGSTQE